MCAQVVPHLEVGRVHSHGVGVLLAQIEKTLLKIVDALHGHGDAANHFRPVGFDGGGADSQIWPVGEVGLSLGVHGDHPAVEEKKSQRFITLCGTACWDLSKTFTLFYFYSLNLLFLLRTKT